MCRQFIVQCRKLALFAEAIVAMDGSKSKAVNNRDKNFTPTKMQRRMAQIEEIIARYPAVMDTAGRAGSSSAEEGSPAREDCGPEEADAAAYDGLKTYEAQVLTRESAIGERCP